MTAVEYCVYYMCWTFSVRYYRCISVHTTGQSTNKEKIMTRHGYVKAKAGFVPNACERFSARFDGRQTFVYAILKHSALSNAIRLLNLFHHNTKIRERKILYSITTKLTIRAMSKTHAMLTSRLVWIQLKWSHDAYTRYLLRWVYHRWDTVRSET